MSQDLFFAGLDVISGAPQAGYPCGPCQNVSGIADFIAAAKKASQKKSPSDLVKKAADAAKKKAAAAKNKAKLQAQQIVAKPLADAKKAIERLPGDLKRQTLTELQNIGEKLGGKAASGALAKAKPYIYVGGGLLVLLVLAMIFVGVRRK